MLARASVRRSVLCRPSWPARLRPYSTASTGLPPLPPQQEWRSRFPATTVAVRDRVTIRNPETAAQLANAFVPEGQRDKVILEAFPGPGALTRALLELPKERVQKIILMEDHEPYLQYLRPLVEHDPRVKLVEKRGYEWDTYNIIEEMGHLEGVSRLPWSSGVHPHLHFISHIPHTVVGEQLVSQFLRCIPDQSWLFRFGRTPLSLILGDWMWSRVSATPQDGKIRCKVSVIAEAVAQSDHAVSARSLMPYDMHFHPIPRPGSANATGHRRMGQPMVAVNITPLATPYIGKEMLDKWDYVLRRLFVKKSTPLDKAIPFLAPGADVLLKDISGPQLPEGQRVDPQVQPRNMSVEDWAALVRAFDDWPFAPEDLMISDAFTKNMDRD